MTCFDSLNWYKGFEESREKRRSNFSSCFSLYLYKDFERFKGLFLVMVTFFCSLLIYVICKVVIAITFVWLVFSSPFRWSAGRNTRFFYSSTLFFCDVFWLLRKYRSSPGLQFTMWHRRHSLFPPQRKSVLSQTLHEKSHISIIH